MDRRQLQRRSALDMSAFAFSRDSFAEAMAGMPASHAVPGPQIRLGSNDNPHDPLEV